jgi:uncharacterized protein YbaR (Trm112 family)
MIGKELLDILVCPQDRTPLELANPDLVAKLNRSIAAGVLRNMAGEKVEQPLDGGLVREDGTLLYPIVDGIPVMLVDEAIRLPKDVSG